VDTREIPCGQVGKVDIYPDHARLLQGASCTLRCLAEDMRRSSSSGHDGTMSPKSTEKGGRYGCIRHTKHHSNSLAVAVGVPIAIGRAA